MSTGVEGTNGLDVRRRSLPRRPLTAESTYSAVDPDQERRPTSTGSTGAGGSRSGQEFSANDPGQSRPPVEGEVQPETEEPHDHPLLIDAHEDRWRWRRKIRRNPRQLFLYRICVGLLGLLLLCLAAVTGPIPGPGGIPLAILGIAVWSSEFEWAQRLMIWFKLQLKRYQAFPRSRRLLFWACFGLSCVTVAYLVLLIFGVPFWVPEFAANWLRHLPGV